LFLGESDLETVRLVQQARVPSIRQINPRVPAELEAVLMKSLALDPQQRYQKARDFGRDLNRILFHLEREVSSFDIAQLVLPIWRERVDKKRRADRGSIIGTLIDEALFEFTSIENADRKSQVSMVGAVPLSLASFENSPSWVDKLGLAPATQAPAAADLEVGNLAALEEEDSISAPQAKNPPRVRPAPAAPLPAPRPLPPPPVMAAPGGSTPPAPAPLSSLEPPVDAGAAKKLNKGGVIGLVVLVVALVGAAGAYLGGLIHH
jgi:serine/threonine-protein kinase